MLFRCDLCGRSDAVTLTREDYRVNGCGYCRGARLIRPEPRDAAWYIERYRSDVPRTDEAVNGIRAKDAHVVHAYLDLYRAAPRIVIDLCAEDGSVRHHGVFRGAAVDTVGIIGSCNYRDYFQVQPDAYDAASILVSLEHVPDPWVHIDAARSFVRPGGMVVVSVPYVVWPDELDLKPHHTWYYEQPAMQRLMRQRGLRVVWDIVYGGYNYVIGEKIYD